MILGQVRWIRYFPAVPKQTERTGLIPFALFPDTVWIKKSNPKVPCHGIRTTLNTLVSFLNIQRITRDVNMKFTAYHTPACHTHYTEQLRTVRPRIATIWIKETNKISFSLCRISKALKNLLLTYSGKTAILITPRENIEKGNSTR